MLKIDLTAGPFYAAVRQAAIVTSDERRGVDFTFGGGKIILAGHGAELGESHVELPIAYDGADVGITLDPRFLSDFLKVLDPEQTFTMELRNAEERRRLEHRRRLRLRRHAVGPRTVIGCVQRRMPIWRALQRAQGACNAPRDETMKTRGPQTIGNVLSELMSRRGYARVQSAAAYDAAWREAAGPLIGRIHPRRRTPPRHARNGRGQLHVGPGIGFQKQSLLKTLAELLPDEGIENLRFRVGNIE